MEQPKKWYQKKGFIISSIIVVGVIAVGALGSNPTPETSQVAPAQIKNITQTANVNSAFEQKPTIQPAAPKENSAGLSNDNYYTSSAGNSVHSPAYSNEVPVGASARCGDGTYSFSQHRSGTCSHHGGVAEWL